MVPHCGFEQKPLQYCKVISLQLIKINEKIIIIIKRITHDPFLGVYKKEEAHLLLKAFQIKGPVDIFVSNFENDNWGLDGYVSTSRRAF